MNNFKKRDNFRGGDRGGFGGKDRGGFGGNRSKGAFRGGFDKDRDSRPVTMHQAVCASCGKTCEIPFKPTGDKPVYCRDCFAGRMAMGGELSNRRDPRSGGNRDFNRGGRNERNDFRNDSRNDFGNSNKDNSLEPQNNEEIKRQLDSLNVKIDKLVYSISKLSDSLNKNSDITVPTKVEIVENPENKESSKKVEKAKTKKISKK